MLKDEISAKNRIHRPFNLPCSISDTEDCLLFGRRHLKSIIIVEVIAKANRMRLIRLEIEVYMSLCLSNSKTKGTLVDNLSGDEVGSGVTLLSDNVAVELAYVCASFVKFQLVEDMFWDILVVDQIQIGNTKLSFCRVAVYLSI
jgi:hypothetical protein